MFKTNIKPFHVKTFKQVCISLIFHLEGYCKYGDRCTFAHGDVDLREKYIPASSLYGNMPSEMTPEMPPPAPPAYGGVDFSAFSQPPDMSQNYGSPGFIQGPQYNSVYNTASDIYHMNGGLQTQHNITSKYYNLILKQSIGYGKAPVPPPNNIPSDPIQQTMPNSGQNEGMSKFGFPYEQPSPTYGGRNPSSNDDSSMSFDTFKIFEPPNFGTNGQGFGDSMSNYTNLGWSQGK